MEAQILQVDLSNRSYQVETLPEKILKNFLGGRGLGAYLLSKTVRPHADPLGEENHLIFPAGPGSGTGLHFASKSVVTTKSPLTNIYLYAVSSGLFCYQLRKAGFWAIDITGIADSPVYIVVNNDKVSFHDATPLWGKDSAEAEQVMMRDYRRNQAGAVTIGPAGEKMMKYAAIMAEGDTYRAFGRGGSGAVMGSKRLKGIVAHGDGVIKPADKARFDAVKRAILDNIKANSKWVETRRRYGTSGGTTPKSDLGYLPTRNWRGGTFEGVKGIDAQYIDWPVKDLSCAPYCPAPCAHDIEITKGPYQRAHCDGPEYETLYALGSNCGIDKYDAVVAAAQICDEAGLDTMSAGCTIAFAMECFENGLLGLEDTGGIDLRFGNDEAMIAVLKQLVNGEGFGRRLAEGVRRLSQEIPGSESFAMQAKGMEFGGYECRGLMAQALQFAINNRGGCHHAYGLTAFREVADGTRMEVTGRGECVKNTAISRIIRDSIILCTFPGLLVPDAMLPDIVSSLFGEPWTMDDLSKVGMRIMCQERLFNMREGITRKDDALPSRLLNEPKPDGPTKGAVVPLETLKDDYYRAMGWDLSTGNPTEAVLDEMEIER